MKQFYVYADENGVGEMARTIVNDIESGRTPDYRKIARQIFSVIETPVRDVLAQAGGLCAPVLFLAVLGCIEPGSGGADGARFLLNLMLLASFADIAADSIKTATGCLTATRRFSDIAAPVISGLLAAGGMSGAASLCGPAGALVGSIAETVLCGWGLNLCRVALCASVAGGLSPALNLNRLNSLMRRLAMWGTGLIITLFTGLVVIQGGISETMDGIGMRTARFAVDSATPVIGSGISDAWDGYISAVLLAKNGFGFSGMLVLLAVSLKPIASCAAAMLMMELTATLLDLFGEKQSANGAEQIAGVCRMTQNMCTTALAIATVLLGAAMRLGRNLII